ncbi:hypothetical protein DFP72DRAFT_853237 [Ephemerocybe angulata]|uniref:NmrA-like domain-containing protein n=1 Tax=Ephemerocybe angulata TaxID=980116 RepID=A0A8H6HKT5_9AGAR|nr:hypothetical protein DFP72DRAFT_853237 [Tulosesus angulatus]
MPAITSIYTVLVTGGTGFIGAWVVATLLQRGHTVRAVVRSEGKGAALKADLIQHLQDKGTKDLAFETLVIEDLLKDGAFDEAVPGAGSTCAMSPKRTFAPWRRKKQEGRG